MSCKLVEWKHNSGRNKNTEFWASKCEPPTLVFTASICVSNYINSQLPVDHFLKKFIGYKMYNWRKQSRSLSRVAHHTKFLVVILGHIWFLLFIQGHIWFPSSHIWFLSSHTRIVLGNTLWYVWYHIWSLYDYYEVVTRDLEFTSFIYHTKSMRVFKPGRAANAITKWNLKIWLFSQKKNIICLRNYGIWC